MIELGEYQAAVGVIVDGSDDDDAGHFPVSLGCSAGMASTWDGLLPQMCCLTA